MIEEQYDEILENFDYVRGFKDALELCFSKAASVKSLKELIQALSNKYDTVNAHHVANIDQVLFSSL